MSFIIPFLPPGIDSPSPIEPYLNGVFPSSSPGSGAGNWEVELAYPRLTFVDPVALVQVPDQSGFYVAGKTGLIWKVSNNPQTSVKTTVLDFSSRVDTDGDAGLLNLILHPEFGNAGSPNRGYMYVVYRYHPNPPVSCGTGAFTRLSRFTKSDGSDNIDPNSEYVLIQQFDPHCWHNGSGMFFGDDGFLYVTFGDAGGADDQYNTSQQIDQMLLGGLMRIDVDQDPAASHPIRRQPVDPASKPAELPASFTQGYYIPNDNPWLDPNGSILEEFYSVGLRSPHRASYDPVTGTIWVGDVGQSSREEVTQIEKGSNSQWPYREGTILGPKAKPNPLIGVDKPPIFDYSHAVGNSVIGGFVYRGAKYASSLSGKYIFGDHGVRNVWTIDPGNREVTFLVNVPGSGVGDKKGISSFATDANGEIYILKLFGTDQDGGLIYKLKQGAVVEDPPHLLSEIGAFSDLATLTPAPGLVPYTVNSPLWSDGAVKKRWIAVPNDGSHDTASEQITFSATSEWQFPEGTVFVKHFELPLNENNPSITKRVETRFIVRSVNGGVYGLTYKWNDEQTDAELLKNGGTKTFTKIRSDGSQESQIWEFPGSTECLTCHNTNSNFILGVKTWQLNGDLTYPSGITDNQLNTWRHLEMFANPFGTSEISGFLRSVPIDNQDESLEVRVRSYIDANCSNCHRPNGVGGAFDARFSVPLASQNIVNALGLSSNTPAGTLIVKPKDPAHSEIWVRNNSVNSGNSMPPLASNLINNEYISVLTEWINGLEDCQITYLTDLSWEGTPINGWGPAEVDQSNNGVLAKDGNILTINGQTYARGLGVHANSEVVYHLGSQYKTFRSFIGVDDETCGSGSVRFQVFVDNELAYQSPILTQADDAVPIAVDVTGASQLKLVVNDGNGNIDCDHADWADAKLEICDDSCSPGTTCNDGNSATYDDVYNISCDCEGKPCPVAGTACNDGNPDTVNDLEDGNCNCAGTPNTVDCITSYLSDLNWIESLTSSYGPIKKNLSYDYGPLTIAGKTFPYGIGTHADATIVYQINGAYNSFESYVGVDDECGSSGSVIFRVYTDGVLAQETPLLTNDDPLFFVSVDLTGVNELRLVADKGNRRINCDHADWADAKLIDCNGSCNPGSACNDGDPSTYNDTFNSECDCEGIPCPAAGTACNDGDPDTENDIEDGSCNCAGTPVCDPVGMPCDDLDDCTEDDVMDADCNCAGIYQDKDGDGLCVGEDPDDNDFCNPISGNQDCDPCSDLYTDDFEDGWGIWNSGGKNSKLDKKESTSGTTSIRLSDDKGLSSSTYTDIMDLNAYEAVEIEFFFRAKSMKSKSDAFTLEISTNGGFTYRQIKEWNLGGKDAYENNIWYKELVHIPGINLGTYTRLRFVCDASKKGKHLYIDDVTIRACKQGQVISGNDLNTVTTRNEETIRNGKTPSPNIGNNQPAGRLVVKASPNPFREELNLLIEKPIPELKEAIVRIMDVNGRIIYQRYNVPFGERVIVPLHAGWTSGIYFIRVQASEYVETVRVIRQ